MNVRKPSGRHRDDWNCGVNMGKQFTPLTSETGSHPQAHVTRKARPNKLRRDQSLGGPDTRMRNIMKQVEKLTLELERNQRA